MTNNMDWLELGTLPATAPGGVDLATTLQIAREATEYRAAYYVGAHAWQHWAATTWAHQTDAPLGLSIVTRR